jgi:large subunit ribosomal protein L29
MKTKDKQSLKGLSKDKLNERLDDLKKEYIDLILKQKIRKIKNLHAAGQIRKDIARVKTIMRLKELTQGESNGKVD